MELASVIRRDTRANQPAATTVAAGTLYYVTDESLIERSTGSAWESFSSTATLSDGDKGDITVSASGATWTIDSGAVSVAKLATGAKTGTIVVIIDGGGATITTGIKGDIEIPIGITITQATLLADQSGSIVIDIWKDSYANYPPTDADSITAAAPPTISTATKSQDSTLTGWTTSVTAGDTLRFNVDSVTTIQRVTLSLKYTKA
jgi:hypothetical protein